MTIAQLFSGISDIPPALSDRAVSGVTSDSREVKEGHVFVCVKGASFDGHTVAEKMLEKGAIAVVTTQRLGLPAEINVENSRAVYPRLLSAFYGHPTRSFKLCGVTGTNGKTTIVNLCAQLTRIMGRKTGVIGTLGIDTGSGLVYSHDGPPTTPEPQKLYQTFARMAAEGTEFCFMEASSQALAQYRFAGENFAAGAFTNLTRDHLDYHGTMENYFLAKRSLFDMCVNGVAIVNIDDEKGAEIADYCRNRGIPLKTVSVNGEADYYTEFVKLSDNRSEFILTDRAGKKSYPVRFAMTGLYNVLNAVEAAVMVNSLGFPMDEVLLALEKIKGVSGRLETLYSGDFTVIRDYAHTEDGLDKLLSTLKPLVKNRLICVFGAAGERDAGKRPDMGRAAAKYSDFLIVTTDSPRHEDPQQTIDGVVEGIPEGVPYEEYVDREKAVFRALEIAQKGDIVALCGKGHEDYQAIGDEYLHFDERELVEEFFRERQFMFSTEEIAKITSGTLVGANVRVSSVSTDTRTIEKGALFVAVKGERFDGNDYIGQAAENGAAAAVSDRPSGSVNADIPIIYVKNTREAQLALARSWRDRFPVKLCGVTGSVGKTSTKDMICAVLSAQFNTLKTEGNFNNDIGLPRTLFGLSEDYKAAVIEMGMSDLGEISALSGTAHPEACVITNIGFCHIENLKSQENILKAKLEILDGASPDAPLILCGGDEYLDTVTPERAGGRRIMRYGFSEKYDVWADDIRHLENGEKFTLHYAGGEYAAFVPVSGEHHILNALAAFCVGISFGIAPERIVPAFMDYQASGMRQRIEKRGGKTVILDCYNASPTSMKSSLSVLGNIRCEGKKIAVLGDMLELGEQSERLHAGLAELSDNADVFFLYGAEMKALAGALKAKGVPVFHSTDKAEMTRLLLENIKDGDAILFKGSRGMRMEEIAEKVN